MTTDLRKKKVVNYLYIPYSMKELKGFLGLIGYYRKFIRVFGIINKLLTKLLKKNNFNLNKKA
jgi:hypothetical protein